MKFATQALVAVGADDAFARAHSELEQLAKLLPDITAVEPIAHRTEELGWTRTDRWHARVLPVALGGFQLSRASWLVTSEWRSAARLIHWEVSVEHPFEAAECSGTIQISPHLMGSEVELSGTVSVRTEALGLGMLGAALRPIAERMLITRIQNNVVELFRTLDSASARVA